MRIVFTKNGVNFAEGDIVRGTFRTTGVGRGKPFVCEVVGPIKFFPHRSKHFVETSTGIYPLNLFEELVKEKENNGK